MRRGGSSPSSDSEAARRAQTSAAPAARSSPWRSWRTTSVACPRKEGGPDGVTNEHIHQLGPVARRALLDVINASWLQGEVPREWRRATIVSIPKAGKDKERVASYRPIALTSKVNKLVERLIMARLSYLADLNQMIPAEQVGFMAKRSVEDNIVRLVQQVQDGWNRPKARTSNPPDESCAQKYVLMAFDFARAYDTIDHWLLRL